MAQYEERTAPARHPGGRDGERLRGYVERPAMLSSAPQASPPQQLLLSLQQTAGNRAVVGLIQRLREESGQARSPHSTLASGQRLIQRAPWPNSKAKFQTDNKTRGAIPNSEYLVEPESYERYAPINEIRLPGQVYLTGPRSFAYIEGGEEKNKQKAAFETGSATRNGDKIVLEKNGEKIEALLEPQRSGLAVWDSKVDDNGNVIDPKDVHVGHGIYNLGIALPTLELDREKLEKVKRGQKSVTAAQKAWLLWDDRELKDLMDEIMEEKHISMAEALAKMKDDPEIGPAIENARRPDAPLEFEPLTSKEKDERFDELWEARRRARERLLAEPTRSAAPEDTGQTLDEMLGAPQGPLATEHGRDQPAEDATADGGPELPQGALADLSWVDDPIWGGLDAGESPESQASSET